jgi:hypothetical protein
MDTTQRRGARVASEIGRDCLAVRVRLLNRAITRIYDAALRLLGDDAASSIKRRVDQMLAGELTIG